MVFRLPLERPYFQLWLFEAVVEGDWWDTELVTLKRHQCPGRFHASP